MTIPETEAGLETEAPSPNLADDSVLWERVRACYRLAPFEGRPQPAVGGLRHQLFRLRTGTGDEYALKALNPLFQNGAAQGENLAASAAQAGLPAVVALPNSAGSVQSMVDGIAVMLFPWKQGQILPPSPVVPAVANQIGALLARLHTLDLHLPDFVLSDIPSFPDAHWTDLICQGQKQELTWAGEAAASLTELWAWSASARQAQHELGPLRVMTHRDMDQKNVLWSEGVSPGISEPWILDWEESGPMAPMLEVMGTGLNWAGQAAGTPSKDTFQAFLEGYQSQTPLDFDRLRAAAIAVLDKWLVWLEFNLRRSLRESGAPSAERVLAVNAARHALATLKTLATETPRRLRWCDTAARE